MLKHLTLKYGEAIKNNILSTFHYIKIKFHHCLMLQTKHKIKNKAKAKILF